MLSKKYILSAVFRIIVQRMGTRLLTGEAARLLCSMEEAHRVLRIAHSDYIKALVDASDIGPQNSDSVSVIKQKGRSYGTALERYSDAVKAFLTVMDTL